jgi:hypothetical protein
MNEGTSGGGRTDDGDSGPDGERRRDGQGESGDSTAGDADGDHVDQGLRAIIEGDAGAARFREPSADERGKLAEHARQKQRDDAKKFAKLQNETRKQAQKLAKKALKEASRRAERP